MNQFSPATFVFPDDIPVQSIVDAVFTRPEGGKPIDRIIMSCGCQSETHTDTEIKVQLSAGYMPEGVKEAGETSYEINKYIQVVYKDDTFEHLWMKGTIVEPTAPASELTE